MHWFGSPKAASSHAGCAPLLRAVQQGHLNHPTEGYVDIAYNHAVCPHGTVYELRGFGCRSGANGTTVTNTKYSAVVYMAGTGDPFTAAGQKAMGAFVRYAQNSAGVGNEVRTHGSITGSTCPGPDVSKWVQDKGWQVNRVKFQLTALNNADKRVVVEESLPAREGQVAARKALFVTRVGPKVVNLWARGRKPHIVKVEV